MSLSDPIADFLTRIRNAKDAKHRHVDMDLSTVRLNLVKVLHKKGFIENFLVDDKKKIMRIVLKYGQARQPVINGLKRVSMPSLRRYTGYKDIPRVLGGMGIAILSTPHGIVDDETARNLKVGGELICYVW
jgi:small subunit ribosomal protein S8